MKTRIDRPLTPAERRQVEENLNLVYKIARMWVRRHASLEPHYDDLVQEGTFGLIKAVQGYDPTKAAFSTYAWRWIHDFVAIAGKRCLNVTSRPKDAGFDFRAEMPEAWSTPAPLRTDPIDSAGNVREVVRKRLIESGESERHVDLFMRVNVDGETLRGAGARHGISRQRVNQILTRTKATFERIAADMRGEAA